MESSTFIRIFATKYKTKMTKLSIIIPVYNVEKYIRPCIESIFKQGLNDKDFEVIIVNDGTEDRSMEVIVDIINAHPNIRIIEQENHGLSIARNNGLEIAIGKYILFIDSDDILISNSLSYLLNIALSKRPDLVVADFLKMNDNEIIQRKSIQQKDGVIQERTGNDMLLLPLYSGYSCVWHTLFKRDFLNKNDIRFIPYIYYEDTPFTMQCYAKAGKCIMVNWLLNIYRIGHKSITTTIYNKKKAMDLCVIISKTWELCQLESISFPAKQKLLNDTYYFFTGLFYLLSSTPSILRHETTEVIHYLKQLAPDLSFKNGLKQRIVTLIYQKMPSTYMTLRIFYARYLQELFGTTRKAFRKQLFCRTML